MKTCNACGVTQPFEHYHRRASSADGHHGQCKACILNKCKSRYEANKNAVAERNKKYRDKNQESILQKKKEYYAQNKEAQSEYYKEYRAENRDAIRQRHSEWRGRSKEHVRLYSRAFRRKMKEATPAWLTNDDRLLISVIYQHARDCEVVTGAQYHVDHIVPLQGKSVCGLHVPWNLQVLPQDVNDAKGNRFEGGW